MQVLYLQRQRPQVQQEKQREHCKLATPLLHSRRLLVEVYQKQLPQSLVLHRRTVLQLLQLLLLLHSLALPRMRVPHSQHIHTHGLCMQLDHKGSSGSR